MTQKTTDNFKLIILTTLCILLVHCKESNPIDKLPVISSQLTMNNVTATTAEYGATITNDNGQTVSSRGICWSTKIDPTVKDSVKTSGQGIGIFTATIVSLKPATTYYIRAFAINAAGTKYGGTLSFTTQKLTNVTTCKVNNIMTTSAFSGGTIVDNSISITAKGICWSTSQNPTTDLATKTNDGTENSNFTSNIVNLNPSTTYYVRAYIVTKDGVAYGSQETFSTLAEIPKTGTLSDVDGNTYHYITIGTQRWMVENLRTTKYRNGVLIGTTPTLDTNILNEITPKYQWANNGDESSIATYGRLYTWYAVNDSRGLAPNGWHIATSTDWTTLLNYLMANGYNYDKTTSDNKVAQSLASNSGWMTSSIIGSPGYDTSKNNSTGLSMYPTAGRFNNGFYSNGFQFAAWTQTEYDSSNALYIQFNNNGTSLLMQLPSNKCFGCAVRCVMD